LRFTLKTLSIIFDYPREEFANLVEARDAVYSLLKGEDEEAARLIHEFLGRVKPEDAEEAYVSVFEVPPKCSLYAHSYALKGKEDMVGQYLLEIKGQYKVKGFDVPVEREIPTFLPVMLEFLSLVYDEDPAAAKRFAKRYLKPWVAQLAECLERNGSPWALPARALVRVVERLAGG